MAATITNTSLSLSGGGNYNSGNTLSNTTDNISLGSNGSLVTPPVGFVYGTTSTVDSSGNVFINDWVNTQLTITTGSTTSVDLFGSTYPNPFGTAAAFATVRGIVVAMLAPDGIKKVLVGPQAVANAAQLGFGGVGSTVYVECYFWLAWFGPAAGWTITTGTADLLPIKNPGGSSVTVNVWVLGTK